MIEPHSVSSSSPPSHCLLRSVHAPTSAPRPEYHVDTRISNSSPSCHPLCHPSHKSIQPTREMTSPAEPMDLPPSSDQAALPSQGFFADIISSVFDGGVNQCVSPFTCYCEPLAQ